jgi:class 3 adenylate cyclase/tetratricopeptide (TPR) repeat protein
MSERTAAQWIERVRATEKIGDYLRAADQAENALADLENAVSGDDAAVLQELFVRTVARSGASDRAAKLYDEFEIGNKADEDALALKGRILKDQALAAQGEERVNKLCQAAMAYKAVFDQTGGSFPSVNAATLFCLAGDQAKAVELADKALAACKREFAEAEQKRPGSGSTYWYHATVAEAELVRGNGQTVAAELDSAVGRLDDKKDYANRASTRKQLSLLCEKVGEDAAILEPITLPGVLFFAGHFISAPGETGRFPADQEADVRAGIDNYLDTHDVGFAFGSLAAGSDLIVAEACLERDIDLHIIMPFRKDDFVEASVKPSGANWERRFEDAYEKVLALAEDGRGELSFATDGAYLDDNSLFTYCAHYTMGLAMVHARYLSTDVRMLSIYDGESGEGVGTYENIALWRSFNLPLDLISVQRNGDPSPKPEHKDGPRLPPREPRAILFGDVKGFSSLDEERLPYFHSEYMARLSEVMKSFGDTYLYVNSWGDAIYAVFADAASAARCGLELQRVTKEIDFIACGVGRKLELRLGGHYGPVFCGWDYVCEEETFFGSQVTRAARIEPITPPGEVFVTEQMAAALALTPEVKIDCDYMGNIPSAKKYGAMRMYVLRNRA